MRKIVQLCLLIFIPLVFLLTGSIVFGQTISPTPTQPNVSDLQKQISEYETKISELQSQGKTLSSQIALMDNKIKLTNLRISSIQQQVTSITLDIDTASKKIFSLQKALDNSINILLNRIVATYETGTIQPLQILLTSGGASDFLQRLSYLKLAQAHDKKLIYSTQQAKTDYANQKNIFEDKKKQIELLKIDLEKETELLASQKNSKENLLTITQNDEKKYQNLLAKARIEFNAIQGIVAGNGVETEVGQVSEGEKIATIIGGSSCNSSGGHVHFMISNGGNIENPFSYLKSIDYNNCSGSDCGSGDGDPFNPSGSWNWPIDGPVTFYQGYGSTWATRNTWVGEIYSSHNGLDIKGSSMDVKAVKSGTLFRGSYTGSGGCRLPYVKVSQENGINSFYLHVY